MRRPPPLISFSEGRSQTWSPLGVTITICRADFEGAASHPGESWALWRSPFHVSVSERAAESNRSSLYSSAAPPKNPIHYADEKSHWPRGSAPTPFEEPRPPRAERGIFLDGTSLFERRKIIISRYEMIKKKKGGKKVTSNLGPGIDTVIPSRNVTVIHLPKTLNSSLVSSWKRA